MRRTTAPNARANLFGVGKPGYHLNDDIPGQDPTYNSPEAMNDFQEEICNVIELAGLALNSANRAQLAQAISIIAAAAAAGGTGSIPDATDTELPSSTKGLFSRAATALIVANALDAFADSRVGFKAAYTPVLLSDFSATPTFNTAASNVFEPAVLTGNVTAMTISNAVAGQTINIRFQQDAVGGRTVALPAGAKISGSINSAANSVSWLIITCSARSGLWEGNWTSVPL